MIQLVTFGIVIDDLHFADGTTHLNILGGGGPQTAWGMAAALGTGESVGIVADVGADLNEQHLAPLINAGVNLAGLRVVDRPTPYAHQLIAPDGTRVHQWVIEPALFDQPLDQTLPPTYQDARGLHWGLHPENPRVEFGAYLTAQGKQISLETYTPTPRPLAAHKFTRLMQACRVFSPNWAEACALTGKSERHSLIATFRAAGCRILALRRGAEGVEVWDFEQGQAVYVPALPIDVIDPVGAGNALCGALLATLDQGIERAACHGVVAASYLLEQIGLPSQLPLATDYQKRLDQALALLQPL
ncbi:MAG: carbohydrate kinase family protein [Anaerolineae bacterium]|jgi:sugar/nucleoside kinase (ribokinase family)|nr:carbohydrate kinase family protein [Anaerolineae bacterium]